jgi:Protein of unknown function (DUF2854)
MLGKISLSSVGLVIGGILTVVGFAAYFADYATLNLAGFFYGIPLLLGGLALKSAELKPVPFSQPTSEKVLALRQQMATEIQNQIRKDVTRYRYGQDAHLDDSLQRFGLNPNDKERPVLAGLREVDIDGNYTLVLEFDSPKFTLETWQEKREKIEKFFGPGLRAEITQPKKDRIDVALITQPKN